MLTLQSNNEIRINKGDSGVLPLFINIGDSFRPIGYDFRIPLSVTVIPDTYYILQTEPLGTSGVSAVVGNEEPDDETLFLLNVPGDAQKVTITLYEDAWRQSVVEAGTYRFVYVRGKWILNGAEVDITKYGFAFPEGAVIAEPTEITVTYKLIDNDSKVFFQMWPILENPQVPLLEKVIYPKYNLVRTSINGEFIYEETINCVNSYGEFLLKFNPQDTINIERGKYLYQLRASLYNKYSVETPYNSEYEFRTIINRTPFYVIDDNFSQRIW